MLLSKVSDFDESAILDLIKSEIIHSIPEGTRILPLKHLYNIYKADILGYIEKVSGKQISNPAEIFKTTINEKYPDEYTRI